MKIGILTFHYAHNYGAMLQAYALVTFLRLKGYDAQIIDYRLPYIYDMYELLDFKGFYKRYKRMNNTLIAILKSIKNFSKHKNKSPKWYQFEDFLNNSLVKTLRVYCLEDINRLQFDCVICGSDQIWNSSLTGRLEPLYFCKGLVAANIISYAASNGNGKVTAEEWNLFKTYIQNFKKISVREKGLSDFLNHKGVVNTVVLDPVFLLEKQEWERLCFTVPEKRFLLTYSFNENPDFFLEAKKLADKKRLQLVCFLFKKNETLSPEIIQVVNGGPKDFVSYFNQASFVVTNSFHGTAFAVLMQKQFYTVPPMRGRERIDSLLEELELRNRIVNSDFDDTKIIDYYTVSKKMNLLRQKSWEFLREALHNDE